MNKISGIFILLVVVVLLTSWGNPKFLTAYNVQNVVHWTGLNGILSIGAAFVIISGGIDLSIGSVVGLTGCLLAKLLVDYQWPAPAALVAVLAVSLLIGLIHGLLITWARLQPFVVTLCGLLIYRGLARWLTHDATQGFGNQFEGLRQIAIGRWEVLPGVQIPISLLLMLTLGGIAAFFLNRTIYGRYLLALGRNEQAARYSGIATHRIIIGAYMICAFCAGLGGILFALDINSIQPAGQGNFYELYAIAAAVLGGCSLRGGEGSILGVIIGTALIRVLYNASNLLGVPSHLEFAIIGLVILMGVLADELMQRWSSRRKLAARGR